MVLSCSAVHACVRASRNVVNTISCTVFDTFPQIAKYTKYKHSSTHRYGQTVIYTHLIKKQQVYSFGAVHKLYNAWGVGGGVDCGGSVIFVMLWRSGGWIVRYIMQGNYKWFMVHNAHYILSPPVYSILVTVMLLCHVHWISINHSHVVIVKLCTNILWVCCCFEQFCIFCSWFVVLLGSCLDWTVGGGGWWSVI